MGRSSIRCTTCAITSPAITPSSSTSTQSLGFKFNGGRNDFDSSGQIPLDLVSSGQLNRFGYMDPSDGGKVRNGTGSVYYKKRSERERYVARGRLR